MVIETLTGALLNDLDDLSDADEEERVEPLNEINDNEDHAKVKSTSAKELGSSFSSQMKRLIDDPKLKRHLESIDLHLMTTNRNGGDDDDRYHLMTTSNKFLVAVEDEVYRAHKDLVAAYNSKFPELEDLLPNPVSYKNAVKVIQNEMDLTRVNDLLTTEANLTSNQIITLSVASSTSQGEPLSSSQLQRVNDCISYMESVLSIKDKLIGFIEKHMDDVAPNMCTLIGPTLAARMVAAAGGIAELSKIPACNLQVLGQVKATSASRGGMSTSISSAAAISGAGGNIRLSRPHEGMLSECDLYNKVPSHLQRKALKLIAAKLALAIRCDYVTLQSGRHKTNESGRKFREEIEKKFAKLEEPDLAPVIKALPKPDMETKKRRGGRRMRSLKEKFSESEMLKQANRRGFSVETGEYGDDAMGLTLGMLEKTKDGSGNIRHLAGSVGDKRKLKQSNTKLARKKAAAMNHGRGQSSGLATSVVFTPVQGLELINPDAARENVKAANKKWFSENSGFQSALPK
mmetsp:Transcript_479/g.808  ORF Transcript_479/g.808 Transcript_479/m.808 type:complete len:517 (+) Transcript_479:133-1683(+)